MATTESIGGIIKTGLSLLFFCGVYSLLEAEKNPTDPIWTFEFSAEAEVPWMRFAFLMF